MTHTKKKVVEVKNVRFRRMCSSEQSVLTNGGSTIWVKLLEWGNRIILPCKVPLFTKHVCLDANRWRPFSDTVGKSERFSWASHNLTAERINTNVTAKYPIRAHLYSIILWGMPLFGCNLEQSSSETAYKKAHLYNTLNLKMYIQEPLSQSLELFLALIPLGKSLLVRGMFPNLVSVGENTACSRVQRTLHSPGTTGDF